MYRLILLSRDTIRDKSSPSRTGILNEKWPEQGWGFTICAKREPLLWQWQCCEQADALTVIWTEGTAINSQRGCPGQQSSCTFAFPSQENFTSTPSNFKNNPLSCKFLKSKTQDQAAQ